MNKNQAHFSCPALQSLLSAALAAITMLLSAQAQATTAPAAAPIDISAVAMQDRGSNLQEGWQHGAFIEIFVRGYKDSNGDGIGDLKGLTQKLDYLKNLGVKGIWLMPITASADHDHGYATTDFRAVETAYGSMADFDELLKEAHARGIGVIIDYVLNHSAATHPLFVQSQSSPTNRYRDWYVWRKPVESVGAGLESVATVPLGWDIWGKNPWIFNGDAEKDDVGKSDAAYFATFGFHMPDFNMRNADVVNYHKDSLRFWLNRGIDGFRLDAVPHLVENNAIDWNDQPESRALTHDYADLIRSYKHRHVVCEATANPIVYGAPDVCGSAFAFGHERSIIAAVKSNGRDATAMNKVANYFTTAPLTMATMLSNHDIFAGQRLWDQLRGDINQYKLAAATYLLQPGTPFIYYGEEIGMGGVINLKADDPLRTPMSWTNNIRGFTSGKPFRPVSPNVAVYNAAAQLKNPHSILAFYKTMLSLRNTLPSIARGSYDAPFVNGGVIGYQRKWGNERTLVLTNYATTSAKVVVRNLAPLGTFKSVFPKAQSAFSSNAAGDAAISLKPQSVMVFLLSQ